MLTRLRMHLSSGIDELLPQGDQGDPQSACNFSGESAYRSQIDHSYISSVARGTPDPGLIAVVQVAAGIGISVTALVAEAGL